ncbi:MAG: excinuclease ABC subunit C, partial [Candidatus Latescibacteria bacterium]|nr:excinuclease ABC subunit C [Candidatus Latescibacterota bacterium]
TWLSQKRGGKVRLCCPQRGNKAKLVNMVTKNAELLLTEWQLKRERTLPHSVAALQKDLKLSVPPRRIEAIDISNIGGTDAVGSLVYFQDGRPKKSEYRRFKIKTVKGQDDFAMVKEVVQRRFRGLKEQSQPLPDLLVVDGGKGQLSSAVAALGELEISDQPVIGLAKKLEEVFLPGLPDPQNIPKTSASLKLLQAVRDEAHRFAVSYHRKLRGKKISRSVLDQIPGVGPTRKAALVKKFGSVKQIAQASVEQIAQVRGISLRSAQIIKERLNNA